MIGSLPTVDRHRQIFATRLRMRQVDRYIVLRHGLNADAVGAFHLQPVNPDILKLVIVPIVGVTRDGARLVDVEAAVAAVQSKQGHQFKQIDVLIDDHLLPRSAVRAFQLSGIQIEAAHELEELVAQWRVLFHAHRQRMIRP